MEGPLKKLTTRASETLGSNSNRRRPLDPNEDNTSLTLEYPDVAQRYRMKLEQINNLDPFAMDLEEFDYTVNGVPPLKSMDIVVYLVLTHSFYTQQQFLAYKSLQAYKYFESGFIIKAGTKVINDLYVLIGMVKHSQSASQKPLNVWCIILKDGSIATAHCTCMAGNSEACSHIAAILFAAEDAYKKKSVLDESTSCTDVLAAWPVPNLTTQVPIRPAREINWGASSSFQSNKDVKPLVKSEMIALLGKIKELGHTCVLHRVIDPFASEISESLTVSLPSVLNIFDEKNVSKQYSELYKIADSIDISLEQRGVIKN